MLTHHIYVVSQVIKNISCIQITHKGLLSGTYGFWTSGKQANCTCDWSVIKSSTRHEQHTVLYLPTVCCLHIYLCFQFPVSTMQCRRMGRSNPSIQSILAIKKYLTSVHCLLRAMYIQRRGEKDGGKKGSKVYGNILGRNWDIFFSQHSVSLMLLLLKGTAQSYPTIKPLMTP